MRALRFDRFGEPHVLDVVEIADPVADNGQAVIAVKAASVNPSDVKNVAGTMDGTVLPRVVAPTMPGAPSQLSSAITQASHTAFMAGLHTTMITAAAAAGFGAVLALFARRDGSASTVGTAIPARKPDAAIGRTR